jgi:hypothetical protein
MSERTYVVGNADVRLEVVIGQGQLGTALIQLNGAEVANGQGTVRVNLGPGSALDGARVRIFTEVNHTSPDSSLASVTYRWNGGPATQTDQDTGVFGEGEEFIGFQADYTLVREA